MDQLSAEISLQMRRFLRIQNTVEDAAGSPNESASRHLFSTRLEVLEADWAKFQEEHDKLCQTHAARLEQESYIKHHTYERCQEFFIQAKSLLLNQQERSEQSNPPSRSSDIPVPEARTRNSRGGLPRIRLPVFTGDLHSWRSFCDLFTSLVGSNEDLSNVEKMHYLKTCLAEDAAKLVVNLRVNDNTFSIAWKALTARYENKRILVSAQLDRLLSLKPIKAKSAQDLNALMATVTESLGALEALNCHTSSWDPLLVHQLSRLLDEDTREAWEVKLGPSTTYPTLKEFEEFVIGHARAWESLAPAVSKPISKKERSFGLPSKSNVKIRGLLATAQQGKTDLGCKLCKSTHFLFKCPTYLSQSFERRKRTALKLNLCFNCLGPHCVKDCPSPRRCRTCSGRHHTTLHDESKPNSKLAIKAGSLSSAADAPASGVSNLEQK